MYRYKAKVLRWVDGDTLLCMIDLGFHTHKEERLRLARVDTPELRGKDKARGKAIQQAITQYCPEGTEVFVETKKLDNYGRFIAEVYYNEQSINQWLIDNGMSEEMHY